MPAPKAAKTEKPQMNQLAMDLLYEILSEAKARPPHARLEYVSGRLGEFVITNYYAAAPEAPPKPSRQPKATSGILADLE